MKIVLLGSPGSGKGTHAQKLSNKFNIPHISTGEIFRRNIRQDTALGAMVKDVLAKGQLVDDEITVSVVKERLANADCNNGFILDGFPRSIYQAVELTKFDQIDFVISIVVPEQQIIERLSGRRYCSACGKIFHISMYDKNSCDSCSANLRIRDDDKVETVAQRYIVYHKTTEPLVEYYNKLKILREVDGLGTIDEVNARILEAVQK